MGKPDLVLWTGPVWPGNLAGVKWHQPTEILGLSCEGSDNCAALLAGLPETGKLEALLRRHQKTAEQFDKIMIGSFSAGHGLTNLLLKDPASRSRISAVGAFDSYYTGLQPNVKLGYDAFAREAAAGSGKLMWSSCSSNPDRQWLSCEDSIQPMLKNAGTSSGSLPGGLAGKLKPATRVVTSGDYVHAFFDKTYSHGEHATVVAPAVFQYWLSPGVHETGWPGWVKALVAIGGVAAAAAGAYLIARQTRRRNPVAGSYLRRLVKHYGVTDSPYLGGYLLPDGQYLDFSEGSGSRALDHRNVTWVLPKDWEGSRDSRWDGMVRVVFRTGMYRWMPESWSLETWTPPTSEQSSAVSRLAFMHPLTIEAHKGRRHYSKTYESWEAGQARSDLNSFYRGEDV